MFNIFHAANWYVSISAVLIFIIIIALIITHAWERRKFRSDAPRAIERLRKLKRGKPLEPEEVETFVQEILEHGEPLNPKLRLPPQVASKVHTVVAPGELLEPEKVETLIEEILEQQELLDPEPIVKPQRPIHTGIDVHAIPNREKLLEQRANPRLPLKVGTKVQAVRNFRRVKKDAPGIITGIADVSCFGWSRPRYLCTFANNIKVHARPKQIEAYNHAYNLEELAQPDFTSILSRQITLRAQQLFSGQRRHVLESGHLRP